MEFKFICAVKERLLTTNIDGNLAIIDTGSHLTLAHDGINSIRICNRVYFPQRRLFHLTVESLRQYVGLSFDIILGCDILREFDSIISKDYIILTENCLENMGTISKLDEYFGVPIIDVELEGAKRRFIVDTGCAYNYLTSDISKIHPSKVITDFNPISGFFTSSVDLKNVVICGRDLWLHFGELPQNKRLILQELSIDGILGVSLLEQFDLQFSYKRGLFSLIERKGG